MRHSNLVEKYRKGQRHFEKGNFRRAKWIFEQIVWELSASDTDSMGDINLHNYAEEYLYKISQQKLPSYRIPVIVTAILILIITLYLILK